MSIGHCYVAVLGHVFERAEEHRTKNDALFIKVLITCDVHRKDAEGKSAKKQLAIIATLFTGTAETFLARVKPGDLVLFTGFLDSMEWTTRDGSKKRRALNFIVENFNLLHGRKGGGQ